MRVAFLGQPGSQSEGAVFQSYGQDIETIHCESFEKIFEAVESGQADQGAVPIENSLATGLYSNYDLLLRSKLHIVGEIVFHVQHYLLALPGVQFSDVTHVLSHPQPLAQCDDYLKKYGFTREACSDTTAAARQLITENLRTAAVIATRQAGEIYGLTALDERIEDDPENYTRFLLVAREATLILDPPYKVSIVFSLENRPRSLYEVLAVFANHNINLAKIESRPLRQRAWEYLFYLDYVIDTTSVQATSVLDELNQLTASLRVLGAYPQDNT